MIMLRVSNHVGRQCKFVEEIAWEVLKKNHSQGKWGERKKSLDDLTEGINQKMESE